MGHANDGDLREMRHCHGSAFARTLLIGLIAFLTVTDLFGTQAILPALTRAYGVSPAAMGFAVNACTLGMAVAGLTVALFSRNIDPRRSILVSLTVLAVPTARLALVPDLATFMILRIVQGLCMASAFTLTLAYLGELQRHGCSGSLRGLCHRKCHQQSFRTTSRRRDRGSFQPRDDVHGPGMSQSGRCRPGLFRPDPVRADRPARRRAPAPVDLGGASSQPASEAQFRDRLLYPLRIHRHLHLREFRARSRADCHRPDDARLRLFRLRPVHRVDLARGPGGANARYPAGLVGALFVAAGLPLLLISSLWAVLAGLTLVGIGTFFAQATATGFVSRTASTDRASASGLYLASHFFGGLVGSFVLGQVFDRYGWAACVVGIGSHSPQRHSWLAGCACTRK
jgi:YNFM family putative membrane transporter